MVVKYVIGLVTRDVGLEQSEAIRVDCADEQSVQGVHNRAAKSILDALADSVFEFAGRSFGEREGDDALGWNTLGE
jgi:hypothetical protein